MLAERGADTEHGQQPAPEPFVGAQGVEHAGVALGEPGQGGQRQIGIGDVHQLVEDVVEIDRGLADELGGPGAVGEAELGEPRGGGFDPGHLSILTALSRAAVA